MQYVLVVDKNREALMPCHPARARQLLTKGKAKVFRRYPFTIMLTERVGGDTQDIAFKVDPGSKTTGMALVVEGKRGKKVVWAAEVDHRGRTIKQKLNSDGCCDEVDAHARHAIDSHVSTIALVAKVGCHRACKVASIT